LDKVLGGVRVQMASSDGWQATAVVLLADDNAPPRAQPSSKLHVINDGE
jgi:hypothetical protein